MSIASRITSIEEHLTDDYNALEGIGADLTNVDKNIENIKNVLADIYDEMPKVTDTGDNITLENTRKGALSITYKGDTQQDSTTGKNLVNVSDGTITSSTLLATLDTSNITGNITLSLKYNNTSAINGVVRLQDGATNLKSIVLNANTSSSGNVSLDVTSYSSINLRAEGVSSGYSYSISNVQIEKGSSATDFEPYTNGASPNPDYPQEIHNVSGDNTINVCGKNLFDKDNVVNVNGKILNDSGVEISDSGGGYTKMYIPTIPNTQYTISGLGSSGTKRIYYFDSTKTFISRTSGFSETSKTITTPSNCYYLDIQYATSGNDFNTYQLEKGSTATEYEAYTGNSQLISLGVENLAQWETNSYTSSALSDFGAFNITLDNSISINTSDTYYFSADIRLKSGTGTYMNTIRSGNNTGQTDTAISTPNLTSEYQRYQFKCTYTQAQTLTQVAFQIRNGSSAVLEVKNIMISKEPSVNYYSYGTTPIELNKIGTYQDYIYKTDKWYLHKEIGKVVLDGSSDENISVDKTLTNSIVYRYSPTNGNKSLNSIVGSVYANIFSQSSGGIIWNADNGEYLVGLDNSGRIRMSVPVSLYPNVTSFKTLLSSNNAIMYYVLETSQEIEITDTTLSEQLETIKRSYDGVTNISQENNDLPFILDVSALKEWE